MSFLGADPVRLAVNNALAELVAGATGEDVETDSLDCKEDPSRRRRDGSLITPGPVRDDRAAEMLADAAACMANSGGGALIVGVEDVSGVLVGTDLDAAWLRGRIHDLTERRLTCAVEPVEVKGVRVLAVLAPMAQEPIRVRGRAKHRVGRRCVEIDASTWAAGQLRRLGFDWSAQSSTVPSSEVRGAAVDTARRYLLDSGEPRAAEMARLDAVDLLRRLTVVDDAGLLTNGGALLFTAAAGRPLVDYRRRDVVGGDSLLRLDRGDVSLLEALAEVEQAVAQADRVVHLTTGGLAVGQVRAVPQGAIREALANSVAHRDWHLADPVIVEFAGDSLVIQSPGGFVEGVDSSRLLTTPPRTRNPHLADVLRRLRVAEREGIGVDRMYREMVRVGHRPPDITERPGPHVRCSLVGGVPNVRMLRLVLEAEPPVEDVDIALVVDHLRRTPAVGAAGLVEVLQKPEAEVTAALARAQGVTFRGAPLVVRTARTARRRRPDFRFSNAVRDYFGRELPYFRSSREDVVPFVVDFVRQHGRIQNADYVELFGVSQPYASNVLRELSSSDGDGLLAPGRTPNLGRDAHYVPGPGFPAEEPG
ncbi:MAG TPA: ATP-binding protein [Mycobacteriales bacterium]